MPEYGNAWATPITHNGEGMNMATWTGIWENWANNMMMQGYKVTDLPGIAQQSGEIFPKNLLSSIAAKNTLFPGADMGYTYDLASGQKQRPVSYSDPSLGMMGWQAMDPSEIAAANQYNSWANNPNNAGFEAQFGNNNYNAWLANSRGATGPRNPNVNYGNTGTGAGAPGAGGAGAGGNAGGIQTLSNGMTGGAGTVGSILGQPPAGASQGTDPLGASGTLGSLMTLPDETKQWNSGSQNGSL